MLYLKLPLHVPPLRIEFPSAVYHVTSRGDRREPIYRDDEDRQVQLEVLAQATERFDAQVLAYCLMGNHYHLVLHTRAANLSRFMRHLNGVYTQRFNRRHGLVGHLFQGRFKVERAAQKTDAKMEHNALLLEDGAEVFAKPELEIYADDVQCAHGNTAGQLDEAAIFYLRQRGLPEIEARAMITRAFLIEALPGWLDESVRTDVETHIDAWLGTAS